MLLEVVLVIVPVVLLGFVEFREGNEFGSDWQSFFEFSDIGLRHYPLRRRSIQNYGAVLGTRVIPLPVLGRGIVKREKHFQKGFKSNLSRIKFDANHLGVTSQARGNLFVGRRGLG